MINIDDIKKCSRLAKLKYDEEKMGDLAKDLNSIMSMVDILEEVDCEDVEPLRSVLEMNQRLENDIVKVDDLSGKLFQNLPKSGADLAKEIKCFVVPKVVE